MQGTLREEQSTFSAVSQSIRRDFLQTRA